MRRLTTTLILLLTSLVITTNALITILCPTARVLTTVLLSSVVAADDNNETPLLGDEGVASEQSDMFVSLKARQEDFNQGIGKRFRVRTQRGFLNVHSSYKDGPYANDNVVNQLEEGDIVTSISPQVVDDWVHHDAGGWIIALFGGFQWLEPLDE